MFQIFENLPYSLWDLAAPSPAVKKSNIEVGTVLYIVSLGFLPTAESV